MQVKFLAGSDNRLFELDDGTTWASMPHIGDYFILFLCLVFMEELERSHGRLL